MAPASAAIRTVSNCNDSGPGSLRNAVANALSGDTIDLASLACSRILLTNRAIQVPQDDLEIVGRHRDALTIDGNRNARVFVHTGAGTLRLRRVSIANGYLFGSYIFGGCIYSQGGVELIGSRVHHCELRASGGLKPLGFGGGILARRVLLSYSSADPTSLKAGSSAPAGPCGPTTSCCTTARSMAIGRARAAA